ncbi:MAG: hypothetical protein KKB31_03900 [Nanoarchaeota archaeon]|nr:hypothetical protein [Nanoarchaeota archaeon]
MKKTDSRGNAYYAIHEFFYDDDKLSWTMDAVAPLGETLDELKEELDMMLKACDKPVMVEDGITLKEVLH